MLSNEKRAEAFFSLAHQLGTPLEKTAKQLAIEALLSTIEKTDLIKVCESLGWRGSDGDYPSKSNFKVAIIHTLIETAKRLNWHVIHDAGFFYIYNGAYWTALEDAEVKQLLKEAAIRMGHTEIECRDAKFVDDLFRQCIQDGFFIERHQKKQSIINLKNGSLHLTDTGIKLKPFDYRDFLTHQLDFDYDETAKNDIFQNYLDVVLPNKDTQKTLQQVAGYLFIKGLKLEKVFFLYGLGSNGKSVFFEVLNGILGEENMSNYSLENLTNDNGYFRAMIKDKIVNYGTDIKLENIDAGRFKQLASGEPIDARLPYKNPFNITDYAKLIFNVNKMDSANVEHTHGFWRRFLFIPFMVKIEDKDKDRDLHKKILQNRAGVLNWIIEGAKQVIENRDLFISAECEEIKTQFMKETDTVAMFEEQSIKEHLRGNFYICKVVECYGYYKDYCANAGYRGVLNRGNFVKRMLAIGFDKFTDREGTMLRKNYAMGSSEKF